MRGMPKTSTYLICLFAVALLFSACLQKIVWHDQMNREEYFVCVERTLASKAGGLAINIGQGVRISAQYAQPIYCGTSHDSTISLSDSKRKFYVDSQWEWQVNCAGNTPENVYLIHTGTANYESERLSLTSTACDGAITVSGLNSGNDYILDGHLAREGTGRITTKSVTKTFNILIRIHFDQVRLSKTNYKILSGSSWFSMKGTIDEGKEFTNAGDIEFFEEGKGEYLVLHFYSGTIELY